MHYIRLQKPDIVAAFLNISIAWCVAAFSLLDIEHAVTLLRLMDSVKRAGYERIASTQHIPRQDIDNVISMTQNEFGTFVAQPKEIAHAGMGSAAAYLSAMPNDDRNVTLNTIGKENPSCAKISFIKLLFMLI